MILGRTPQEIRGLLLAHTGPSAVSWHLLGQWRPWCWGQATMVVSTQTLRWTRPALWHLSWKQSQELLTLMSHCFLYFFFYLGPFHTFLLPSGILFYHPPLFPIFQSQLKGCLLTHFLAPSPALAVLFLYGFLIFSFIPLTYILNYFRNYPVFICVFSISLPTTWGQGAQWFDSLLYSQRLAQGWRR